MSTPEALMEFWQVKDIHAGSDAGSVSIGVGTVRQPNSKVCERARALAYRRTKKRKKEQQ